MPLYAEEVNYWQTSQSSADTWLDRSKKEIRAIGGKITGEAFGSTEGRSAFMLAFDLAEDQFKVVWPVLPSKTKNDKAAKIQAATMMYHDVKSKCISAKVLGGRVAFFAHLLLPDGRAASEAASHELARMLPSIIMLPSGDRK